MINVFDLPGYTPNLFEDEPVNIFDSIDTIITEKPEDNWNNLIFHAEPETPKRWVDYYRPSAINGEFLMIDDLLFKDHWKEYHSWADEWDCCCKEDDRTKCCYCADNKISEKCSQW
jgi:hypothetical protein